MNSLQGRASLRALIWQNTRKYFDVNSISTLYLASTSTSYTITPAKVPSSCSGTITFFNPSRFVHIPRQEAYGHPEWQTRTVDASLFEEEDASYVEHNEILGKVVRNLSRSKRRKLRKQDHRVMLVDLISQEKFAEAHTWLKDLANLKMEIEPDARYSILALDQAKQNNWDIAMQWLNLVPARVKRSTTGTSKQSQHTHLAQLLQLTCSEEVESSIALKVLFHLARFGYLSVAEIGQAAHNAFKWHVQYGELSADAGNQAGAGIKTLRIFRKMVILDAKHFDQVSEKKSESIRGPNTRALSVIFNSCIRTFCQAGQVAKASVWVKSSPIFLNEKEQAILGPDICDATLISPVTWRTFVERVDSMGNNANAATKKDIIQMTEFVSESIDEEEQRDGRSWALSKWQKNLTSVYKIGKRLPISLDGDNAERSPTFFARLKNNLRANLSHDRHDLVLRNYFQQIYDPQLESIARNVLSPEQLKTLNLNWKREDRTLPSDISVSLLALEGLVKFVYNQREERRIKLETLYNSWIASVAHLQTQPDPMEKVSSILNETDDDNTAQNGAIAPTFSHFLLFMQKIPRAFSYDIFLSQDEQKDAVDNKPQHDKAQEWSLHIIADMQRFGFEPDRRFWQILIEILARGLTNKNADDGQEEKSKLKAELLMKLLENLGIGQKNEGSISEFVSPFTYTSLIRALLSVPKIRGGPLIEEAEKVQSWFKNDASALQQVRDEPELYEDNIKEMFTQLEIKKQESDL